jgi:hypothetical protein
MTQSNTAVLLQSKKKKANSPLVERKPEPAYKALSKRVMDEYKCALLKRKA